MRTKELSEGKTVEKYDLVLHLPPEYRDVAESLRKAGGDRSITQLVRRLLDEEKERRLAQGQRQVLSPNS